MFILILGYFNIHSTSYCRGYMYFINRPTRFYLNSLWSCKVIEMTIVFVTLDLLLREETRKSDSYNTIIHSYFVKWHYFKLVNSLTINRCIEVTVCGLVGLHLPLTPLLPYSHQHFTPLKWLLPQRPLWAKSSLRFMSTQ